MEVERAMRWLPRRLAKVLKFEYVYAMDPGMQARRLRIRYHQWGAMLDDARQAVERELTLQGKRSTYAHLKDIPSRGLEAIA